MSRLSFEALGSARLTLKQIAIACALVALAAVVLGASRWLIGPNTAMAGYLTILFLLAVVRANDWRSRLQAALWSLTVALVGFAVGGLGLWVTLIALVVVALAQGLVTMGETVLLTRSPVNLLAFASLGQSGAQLWHVLAGAAIGSILVLGFAAITNHRGHLPSASKSVSERLWYGFATAAGAVIIVLVAELIDFPYVGWTLLSFSIMLSFDADQRANRGYLRLLGSLVGALAAVGIAALPAPVPMIAAVVCMVLCVAYLNAGNYALFMLFITPAVLLTAASEYSLLRLGLYRLEAALFASFVALTLAYAVRKIAPTDHGFRISV